jgi:CubicO group peptidase (beta-lactamase class C family)
MKNMTLCFLLFVLAAPVFGANDTLRNVPRVAEALRLLEIWLDAERDYEQIPGISIAIVHDQNLVWSRGFGYAHPDKKIPATPKTIYSICSISKLFTSIAVLQLRDRGLLHLDDPVGRHLPWFAIKQAHPEAAPVTVRGLLTHSSGLPRESDFPYWSAPDFDFPSREEMIKRLSNQETLYPADTYFQYSNLGITLAGELVTAISKQPYEVYVAKHILEPLGLTDTHPEMPEQDRGGRLATGHSAKTRQGTREKVGFFQTNGIAPAAGYSSTVEDLAKFASWQFRALANADTAVLKRNTLREMQRVQWMDPDWKTTWGLGFSVWQSKEKTFAGDGGSCPGFRSQLLVQPKEKIAVIVMTNASGLNTGAYAQRAYEIVAPAIAKAMKSDQTEQPADSSFKKYAGLYSGQPWGGETAVIVWEGALALVGVPSDDPLASLTKLKHVAGNRFRRVRQDDELGEEIIFETGKKGEILGLRRHSNMSPKIR